MTHFFLKAHTLMASHRVWKIRGESVILCEHKDSRLFTCAEMAACSPLCSLSLRILTTL